MLRKDIGIQVDTLQVLLTPNLERRLNELIEFRINCKRQNNPKEIMLDIENHITDNLLNKRTVITNNQALNSWVKDPFNRTKCFVVENDDLICIVSENYEKIKKKCDANPSLQFYMSEIDDSLKKMLAAKKKYFNKFNKMKFKDALTLSEGFAAFVIWICDQLKEVLAGFVVDFTVLLYISIYTHSAMEEANLYFISNYIYKPNYPDIENAVKLYKSWLGTDAELLIDPRELVSYLCDYFRGVSIPNFVDSRTKNN